MCLALGVQVAVAVDDKRARCDPLEFPLGVLLLNKPPHTIARASIRLNERTEEAMRGGRGGRHTDVQPNTSIALFPPSLPLSLSLSLRPGSLQIEWLSDKGCDYIDLV